MNRKRTEAFNDWWLLKASQEGRTTPSAIWDAACDWMKEEILWQMEHDMECIRNDRES